MKDVEKTLILKLELLLCANIGFYDLLLNILLKWLDRGAIKTLNLVDDHSFLLLDVHVLIVEVSTTLILVKQLQYVVISNHFLVGFDVLGNDTLALFKHRSLSAKLVLCLNLYIVALLVDVNERAKLA